MQAANRSATRRRFSTSRSASTPPLDDNSPPSNLATTDLPDTGDRPGSGSIGSFMAGGGSRGRGGVGFTKKNLNGSNTCAPPPPPPPNFLVCLHGGGLSPPTPPPPKFFGVEERGVCSPPPRAPAPGRGGNPPPRRGGGGGGAPPPRHGPPRSAVSETQTRPPRSHRGHPPCCGLTVGDGS